MLTGWPELKQKLLDDARKNNVPISGQFELTSRCNLQCKMCYVCQPANAKNVAAQELSAKEWLRIAEEAKKAGMLYLLLTGGEVFIRKDFKEIYEELAKMGFFISIFTNGTLITPQIAQWLAKIPPRRVGVTLYGASPETYRKVTGKPEAFQQTLNGIAALKAEGIKIQLKTTVIRDNATDYENLLAIADKNDCFLKFVYYISDRRDRPNEKLSEIRLSAREIADYEQRAGKDYVQRFKARNNVTFPDKGPEDEPDAEDESPSEFPFKCRAGKSEFWVTWNGKITACAVSDDIAEDIREKPLMAAWEKLVARCKSVPPCVECRDCELLSYCWTCPVRLKLETGSYEKAADYFCEWAKYRKIYF